MTAITPDVPVAVARPRRPNPLLAFARRQPLGAASALFILLLFALAVGAEAIASYDPLDVDYEAMLGAPSAAHPLGTDSFGRDILSRVIYGARTALAVGVLSSLMGCVLGTLIGATSAYFGGRFDLVVQRVVDMLLAFPIVILALVVVAALGRNVVFGIDVNLILAIAIPIVPKVARVARSSALSVRQMPYIDAARAAGYSSTRIIIHHVCPNIMAPVLILFTAFIAQAILLEASLSFLGLGVTEPTPAWGLMLSGNSADFYQQAPWVIVFPGLAISLAVFAFNLFGDSLRDWLDPRLKI